jgi:hypothetical protein
MSGHFKRAARASSAVISGSGGVFSLGTLALSFPRHPAAAARATKINVTRFIGDRSILISRGNGYFLK